MNEVKFINNIPLCDTTARTEVSKLSEEIADLKENGTGTSWTNAQIDLLDEIGNYLPFTSADGGKKWDELIESLRSGASEEPDVPEEPDNPEVTLTRISATYNGGDVTVGTSVNSLTGITVKAHYSDGTSKTITGYTLSGEILEGENTITVSYGGLTTTFTVIGVAESGGEVTAELITDGLLGYWDFRNPMEVVTQEWHWAYPSNEGNGGLYASATGGSKGSQAIPEFDSEYGTSAKFHVVGDNTTYPNNNSCKSFGTEFTIVMLSKGASSAVDSTYLGIAGSNIEPRWEFKGKYNTQSGEVDTKSFGSGNGDDATDYNFLLKRVNGAEMKVIMDTSSMVFDGANYENFVSWYDKVPTIGTLHNKGNSIAVAIYNHALSDVEIEEMRAFMKTLEVA